MRLNEVLQFMKGLNLNVANYYIGKLNNKKDNSLGVYNMKGNDGREIAIGGESFTNCRTKGITLLVHGTKNKTNTETLAFDIYDALAAVRDVEVLDYRIDYIELLYVEPIDVDVDDNGVYEYTIDLKIHYTRRV